ncbi:selection and upkeep of intraepithelial T-cells protein 7-like [Peromyscus leucopus]|uniref:selection and upkeep of intraepithelial T-cells protein 7-like n=1 Tax=Peromyscus leucopus TaxID=10041 RepID=UPI0010A165D8|nr:selection and upkeep of intraepithelial T-cells protein 7-like [Peromyscus leucopus]
MMKLKFSYFSGYYGCFLFLQVMVASEKSMVTTPTRHVLARVGGQAELSCQVTPLRSLEYMDVSWFRSGHSQPVYLYRGGHGVNGEAAPEYVNRTEFVKDAIGKGRVALRIHNISISDDGLYQCSFNDDSGFNDVTSMKLSVAAVGLETQIHVQAPDANGVMVECNSGGWFPQPQMEWRDSRGKVLPPSSKSYSQDEARFFHMKMTLLTNQSQSRIICYIFNPVTGEEKQTSIILANDLFMEDSIWMNVLVFIVCIMLLAFLIYISCLCRPVTTSKLIPVFHLGNVEFHIDKFEIPRHGCY